MDRRIRATFSTICVAAVAAVALTAPATPAAAAPASAGQEVANTADSYCDVTFTLLVQWSTGYGAGFSVRNHSAVPVRWRLVLKFIGPVLGLQVWNANATLNGSVATVIPIPPHGTLAPGQTVMVGMFYAGGSGNDTLPRAEVTCTPA